MTSRTSSSQDCSRSISFVSSATPLTPAQPKRTIAAAGSEVAPELLVDAQLSVKGLDILVRAVGTRYRLSPKSRQDLADNLVATLNSLGDQLLPPER